MTNKIESLKDDVESLSVARIRERAYRIWQTAGEPNGLDAVHWTQAEQELRAETRSNIEELQQSRVLEVK